eukprot:scaffold4575_cov55-Phaeocystis_antarctica.AAC.1
MPAAASAPATDNDTSPVTLRCTRLTARLLCRTTGTGDEDASHYASHSSTSVVCGRIGLLFARDIDGGSKGDMYDGAENALYRRAGIRARC